MEMLLAGGKSESSVKVLLPPDLVQASEEMVLSFQVVAWASLNSILSISVNVFSVSCHSEQRG